MFAVGCSGSEYESNSEDESEENPPKAKRRKRVHKSGNQTEASKDANQTKGRDIPEATGTGSKQSDTQQDKSTDAQQAEHTKTQQDTVDKKMCVYCYA